MFKARKHKNWSLNLFLAAGGAGIAGLMIAITLQVFPQLRPNVIEFTVGMGDILFHHPEWLETPENPDEVLSRHRLAWDDDGFRIPAWVAPTYDILAVGDSYTDANNVARPWPDTLAEAAGTPVRNLGYRGTGPVQQAHILDIYGPVSGANTVIIGYFEGNDLSDARPLAADEITLPSAVESPTFEPLALPDTLEEDPRYPVTIEINGQQSPMAFLEWYLWDLNVTQSDFRQSENLQVVVDSWEQMRAAMPDACLVIAYFPSKGHIYVPYVIPQDQNTLTEKLRRNTAEPGQRLQLEPSDVDYDGFVTRLDNQRDVMAETAAQMGLVFFDTTPILQAATARGDIVYYVYDTHWTQHAHDLVGQALADFLATAPCD